MEELISVIVPVYNAEKYIGECLKSIVNQTYTNLEIIVVNDGSTDGSSHICQQYANEDTRIIMINQPNQGLVAARKSGLSYASGQYVCFVDGDDWLARRGIELLYRGLYANNADVSIMSYTIWDNGEIINRDLRLPKGLYETQQQWDLVYENCCEINSTQNVVLHNIWGKLYKMDLYRKAQVLVQDDITVGEDLVCMYAWIRLAKKVWISDERIYFYRFVPDSMIRRKNENVLSDINRVYTNICRIDISLTGNEKLRRAYMRYLNKWAMLSSVKLFETKGSNVYLFPYTKIEKGAAIILYGAGRVGQCYYKQVIASGYCRVIGIADKESEKCRESDLPIITIEEIREKFYDNIVIAIRDKQVAENVRETLLRLGVAEEKVVWDPPQILEGAVTINYI